MRRSLIALLALVLPSLARADDGADVRRLLDDQVAAWNRRDLDGFMAGYWRSPALTFYGSSERKGWDATIDAYRKHYQGAGGDLGHLEFRAITVDPLGDNVALARGRFHLVPAGGGKPSDGLFTLILRKRPEGWRIIHDHSSALAKP